MKLRARSAMSSRFEWARNNASKVQCALGEKLLWLHLSRRQSLLVREAGDRVQHRLIGFDAVGKRVVADHAAGHREILRAEEKRAGNTLQQFLVRERLGFDKAAVKIERNPGIFAVDIAADDVSMIDGKKAVLLVKARALGHSIRKQRADLTPVIFADYAARAIQSVRLEHERTGDVGDIQFLIDQSRYETFVRRNALKRNPLRRLEAGGAAVAHFFAALHVPMNFVLRYTEVVFENAANPERGGWLVFGDAEAFAGAIFGFRDAGVEMIGKLGLKQTSAREHRQRDHVGALGFGDQEGRHRHLRHFELAEFQLAPESFRGMRIGWNNLDAFRFDRAVHQRLDTLVECRDKS